MWFDFYDINNILIVFLLIISTFIELYILFYKKLDCFYLISLFNIILNICVLKLYSFIFLKLSIVENKIFYVNYLMFFYPITKFLLIYFSYLSFFCLFCEIYIYYNITKKMFNTHVFLFNNIIIVSTNEFSTKICNIDDIEIINFDNNNLTIKSEYYTIKIDNLKNEYLKIILDKIKTKNNCNFNTFNNPCFFV